MSLTYRPEIDGLRAIAVLAVVVFHAFPAALPGGFVGVDVFFVISGFLITSILLHESQGGSISIAGFYARRIVRIFPALVLVLLACFLVGWNVLFAAEYKALGKHILGGTTFVSNIMLWTEAGYFDNASELKPLLHLWSLGIEEQFYIVWPVLMLGLVRMPRRAITLTLCALLASLVWACYWVFEDRTHAFYSPLARAWELLAGALLAWAQFARPGVLAPLRHRLLPWLGLVMILASAMWLSERNTFPGAWAAVPVLGTCLLLVPVPGAAVHVRLLSHPWMVNIGLISYPLYLWHWPLLSFANILEGQYPSAYVRAGLVLLTFVLAALTYHGVEKPIRRLPRKFSVGVLLVLMVVLGVLGKNVYDRDGLERIRHKKLITLSPEVKQDFVEWEDTGLLPQVQCAQPFQFPGSKICLTTHPDRAPTAAVIGDSHAFHAYWGLSRSLDRQGKNLILLGRGACLPFVDYRRGADTDRCQPHINETLAWVRQQGSIQQVFLIFRGRYLSNGSSPSDRDALQVAVEQTLQQLLKAGKKVYVFLPLTEPGFDPRLCVGSLPWGRKSPASCDASWTQDLAKRKDLMEVLGRAFQKYPSVRVIDPSQYLCADDVCPLIRRGKSVFKDENHLSYSGSLLLGDMLSEAGALQ